MDIYIKGGIMLEGYIHGSHMSEGGTYISLRTLDRFFLL
jgi:hypothetical protein